jgi:hypothetical protein
MALRCDHSYAPTAIEGSLRPKASFGAHDPVLAGKQVVDGVHLPRSHGQYVLVDASQRLPTCALLFPTRPDEII